MTKRAILLQALASTIPDLNRLVPSLVACTSRERGSTYWQAANTLLTELVVRERIFQKHVALVITEDRPRLSTDVLVPSDESSSDSLTQTADQFAAERHETLARLSVLQPGQWQRVALVEGSGPRSLRFLIQDLVDSDIACTNQLVQILVSCRKAESASQSVAERLIP